MGTLRIFPGTLVKVAGRPRPNATRFAINFQTGPSTNPRDDLALHLSPCFTPPRVVRNSLIQQAWGVEESWGNGSVFSPHAPFEIMIMAEQEQFKIAINGAHYCEFRHRIPYQQITHLTIDGDVDIERICVVSDAYGSQQQQPTAAYQSPAVPSAPPSQGAPPMAPYPTLGGGMPMPTPTMYPNLAPGSTPSHYPNVPAPSMPAGPAPTPASYASGYPSAGLYPQQAGPYPTPPGGPPHAYPQMPPTGGPVPAPTGYYQGGYPVSICSEFINPHFRQPLFLVTISTDVG